MKKLFTLSIALFALSCATPEQEQQPQYNQECGIIVGLGEDQRGDYIIVKMPSYTYQKDRYKVGNYQDYHISSNICNFEGLIKEDL